MFIAWRSIPPGPIRSPPARTSKPKFRLDAASALVADEPPPRDGLELARLATARLGKDVLELQFPAVGDDARSPDDAANVGSSAVAPDQRTTSVR